MKVTNTKFHGNPSSESCTNACRRTDITKLIDTFHDYVNVPKNQLITKMCLWRNKYSIL
jgi:hypothetical protein